MRTLFLATVKLSSCLPAKPLGYTMVHTARMSRLKGGSRKRAWGWGGTVETQKTKGGGEASANDPYWDPECLGTTTAQSARREDGTF